MRQNVSKRWLFCKSSPKVGGFFRFSLYKQVYVCYNKHILTDEICLKAFGGNRRSMNEGEQTKGQYCVPLTNKTVDLKRLPGDNEELLHVLVQEGDSTEDVYDRFSRFAELLMRYSAAIREVRTKFEVLNEEFSFRNSRNPIESISSRVKRPISILDKLRRRGLPMTVEAIEESLNDVAGVRVICSFIDDIYAVAEMFARQDDITVLEVKDYIRKPKQNGYRSYHMIVEIPVFFSDGKRPMRVEIQLRTVAMDFWASLEHQMKYKKDSADRPEISAELKSCAETIAATDARMLGIRKRIEKLEKDRTDSGIGEQK